MELLWEYEMRKTPYMHMHISPLRERIELTFGSKLTMIQACWGEEKVGLGHEPLGCVAIMCWKIQYRFFNHLSMY